MSKPTSSGEKFHEAVRKEFMLIVIGMLTAVIGYTLFRFFASEGSENRRVFDDGVKTVSRILVGLVTIVFVVILARAYTSENPEVVTDLKGFFERVGGPGYKRFEGKWVRESWMKDSGRNYGTGAFVMGPDARFVPSKSEAAKAGAGRDLYRERKSAHAQRVAESRAAKEEQRIRLQSSTGAHNHHGAHHKTLPHYAYYYPSV